MITEERLKRFEENSKLDNWHYLFVGSDIREMLGEIRRLQRSVENLKSFETP